MLADDPSHFQPNHPIQFRDRVYMLFLIAIAQWRTRDRKWEKTSFFFVFKVDKQLWISLIFLKTKICLFLMINFTIFACLVFRFANDNEFPAAPRNSNLLSSCVRNRLNVSVLVHILRRHNWPTFKRLHGPISLGQGGLVFDNNTSHGTSNQSNAQKECTQLSP